jgi:hypothetical protein
MKNCTVRTDIADASRPTHGEHASDWDLMLNAVQARLHAAIEAAQRSAPAAADAAANPSLQTVARECSEALDQLDRQLALKPAEHPLSAARLAALRLTLAAVLDGGQAATRSGA